MAERPILFSAPMVRALLDGRKTQTRRMVKPGPGQKWLSADVLQSAKAATVHLATITGPGVQLEHPHGGPLTFVNCPYGAPGDLLWVRESFTTRDEGSRAHPRLVPMYAADFEGFDKPDRDWDWSPSIHMPRWASRITLRVADVRVERLNEISEADALAEGVEPPATEREDHDWSICPECGGTGLHGSLGEHLGYMEVDCRDCDTHAKRYRHLWQAINGPGSWDANPWVWAVTFERVS